VKIWDISYGEAKSLNGHNKPITSSKLSPCGRYSLTGSADMKAILWDTKSGLQLRKLTGHSKSITSVSFSPNSE